MFLAILSSFSPEANHTLAQKKQGSKALKQGGFRIIYAEGQVFAYVRFWEKEAVVVVWSTEDKESEVVLPLEILGQFEVTVEQDVLGKALDYTMKEMEMYLKIPAHTAYMFWVNEM